MSVRNRLDDLPEEIRDRIIFWTRYPQIKAALSLYLAGIPARDGNHLFYHGSTPMNREQAKALWNFRKWLRMFPIGWRSANYEEQSREEAMYISLYHAHNPYLRQWLHSPENLDALTSQRCLFEENARPVNYRGPIWNIFGQ